MSRQGTLFRPAGALVARKTVGATAEGDKSAERLMFGVPLTDHRHTPVSSGKSAGG